MNIVWPFFLLLRTARGIAGLTAAAAMAASLGARADEPYVFHVTNQRSASVPAQYWKPILDWVARTSGVALDLRVTHSEREAEALRKQGAYQFVYSNRFFTPECEKLGFRVIARAAGSRLRGQIVVKASSPITGLEQLSGKQVAFGSPDAFVAYWLPMDALLRAKANAKVIFMHEQETGLAQLAAGRVAAVAVNEAVVERYARLQSLDYRLLWDSDVYSSPAIMVSPKVPASHVAAVRSAFLAMSADSEGRRVLEAGAQLLRSSDALGFVAASDREYDNYRAFYKTTVVQAAN